MLTQVVDKATGETDAVDTKEALKGKYTALYFTSKQVEDQFLQGNEVKRMHLNMQ
jgi:hypothetical protein